MENKEKILNQKRAYHIDEIASKTEQFCNNMYSPKDKMWNILLGFRDKLRKEHDKLINEYGYLPENLKNKSD